jgi:tetratricopeptide (TPR) repeat protein
VASDIPGGHAGELGRFAETLAAYQQVIDRYGEDPAPALRARVAAALYTQGVVFGNLGRFAEALAAYQQVIDRYGEDPAPALREQVAAALYNHGAVFGELGRFAETLAAYQQVIDRYGEDPGPARAGRASDYFLFRHPRTPGDLTD